MGKRQEWRVPTGLLLNREETVWSHGSLERERWRMGDKEEKRWSFFGFREREGEGTQRGKIGFRMVAGYETGMAIPVC